MAKLRIRAKALLQKWMATPHQMLPRGKSLSYALEKAACLLERSVARAYEEGVDPNEGVAFEEYLYLLAEPPQERLEQRNHRKEAL